MSETPARKFTAAAARIPVIAAVLRTDSRTDFSISSDQHRAGLLAEFGDRRIGLLAHFLTDYDLGDDAAETMNFLDRDRAAPLLFASMPRSDRNVQFRGFGRFNARIRDGERVCCRAEMHAAAVRCLEADTNADAAERALYAVGLTGDAADFPLLLRYFESAHPTDYWRLRLRRAAGAALARLGSAPHLQRIEDELAAAVPRAIDSARAIDLSAVLDQAAFTGADRYLPLLCRHLDDPFPRDVGHSIPPMPAQRAAVAIDIIARQTPPSRASEDVAQARAWCSSRG
jgi:hypothetical protein